MGRIVPWAGAAERFLIRDSVLGPIVERVGPIRLETRPDLFRSLVRSVVGQQLSGTAARSIYERLERSLGGMVTPERITEAGAVALRRAGLSRSKAMTLCELSEAWLDGLPGTAFARLPDSEVERLLTKIKGIGPWTVQMFLLFGLGRPDVSAPGDLGIRKGVQRVLQAGALPSVAETAAQLERWRPYRSGACWYLWRALELPVETTTQSSV